jgi:topoisomerase (DNA) II binding protein 1
LGGKVEENDFEYLVMAKISKSAKFFSALARGKYVLHTDYIKECDRHGQYVDKANYEFGNPLFMCSYENVIDERLKTGAYRCRLKVEKNREKYKDGLFTGLKFILVISEDKIHNFRQVILAGGGEIVDEKPEFKASLLKRQKIDYCLIDTKKNLSDKDVATLKACNVKVNNVTFLYEFILSD